MSVKAKMGNWKTKRVECEEWDRNAGAKNQHGDARNVGNVESG